MKYDIGDFQYFRCPLNRYTFKIRDIREWVESQTIGRTLNLFAGYTKLNVNEIRVDLDENAPADFHMDAFDYLLEAVQNNEVFDTVILDPPYALRKSMEMYGGRKVSSFHKIKNELPGLCHKGSRIITLGYHSNSMGNNRGFETISIALFSHGGAIHDTIGVVEEKKENECS